jgi:hypothetical protein
MYIYIYICIYSSTLFIILICIYSDTILIHMLMLYFENPVKYWLSINETLSW